MTGLRLVRAVDDGNGPGAVAAGLLQLWAQWMRAGGMTGETIRTRVGGVRALAEHSRQPDLTAFIPAHIVAWLAGCRTPNTRYTYAVSARQWHRWLVDQGLRNDDPMTRVPKPQRPHGVPRPVPEDALADALEIAGRRGRAYLLLAAYEGLRVHEIAKVRGEDFADGWLYVVGKGGEAAAVPVHPLVEQLRRGWPTEGWWFPGRDGGPVRPKAVSRTISETFRRVGYRFTAHQGRHRFGTQVQRSTRDIRVTQELLRHRSLASTQIYTEVSGAEKVAAVRRLTQPERGATRGSAGPGWPGGPDTRASG